MFKAPNPQGVSGREWCYVEPQVAIVCGQCDVCFFAVGQVGDEWRRSLGLLWCVNLRVPFSGSLLTIAPSPAPGWLDLRAVFLDAFWVVWQSLTMMGFVLPLQSLRNNIFKKFVDTLPSSVKLREQQNQLWTCKWAVFGTELLQRFAG